MPTALTAESILLCGVFSSPWHPEQECFPTVVTRRALDRPTHNQCSQDNDRGSFGCTTRITPAHQIGSCQSSAEICNESPLMSWRLSVFANRRSTSEIRTLQKRPRTCRGQGSSAGEKGLVTGRYRRAVTAEAVVEAQGDHIHVLGDPVVDKSGVNRIDDRE